MTTIILFLLPDTLENTFEDKPQDLPNNDAIRHPSLVPKFLVTVSSSTNRHASMNECLL